MADHIQALALDDDGAFILKRATKIPDSLGLSALSSTGIAPNRAESVSDLRRPVALPFADRTPGQSAEAIGSDGSCSARS